LFFLSLSFSHSILRNLEFNSFSLGASAYIKYCYCCTHLIWLLELKVILNNLLIMLIPNSKIPTAVPHTIFLYGVILLTKSIDLYTHSFQLIISPIPMFCRIQFSNYRRPEYRAGAWYSGIASEMPPETAAIQRARNESFFYPSQ